MTTPKPIHQYARRYVERFGLSLVPIEPGRKFPTASDWGHAVLDNPDEAEAFYQQHPDWNMGMALHPSRMCSLDIDCATSLATALGELGIDIETEFAAFPTIVGNPKGSRVTFRVPDGAELPYCKLTWPTQDDPAKRYTVCELRAATDGRQRQDVLPPSMHPDTGEPYRWSVQPRDDWPEPPPWLLAIWEHWDDFKPQLQDACPWAPTPQATPARTPKRTTPSEGTSVIDAYTAAVPLRDALLEYGYRPIGKRYLSPHSTTKLPGVVVLPDEHAAWVHHASDPLCSEESGQPVNAFDLFCHYEHGGDTGKAVKAAARQLGMERSTPARAEATTLPDEPEPDTPEQPHGPFRALGYSGSHYYYLPRATEQVAEIRRAAHTSASELLALAPLEWWEVTFPKPKGDGADWQQAGSTLMRACERRGVYSPEQERGRGAWYDDGRAVLHLGDRILVDGQPHAISDHRSRHIYTRQTPMESDIGTVPAGDEEAQRVASLIGRLNWSSPTYALMCAGWVALAPICGALSWRPHIWLTAQRGAGKSWTLEHIIYPLVGTSALHVQGGTTEAGIRQRLRQDARPVIFDEAEGEGQKGQQRIQSVIELARQASSDSGAEIVKGTSGGEGMAFRARSMFMLGSVNVGLVQAADESRFTVLSLGAPQRSKAETARFDAFSREVDGFLTRETCASLRARMYRLIPTVRENARTFARAVAEELGSQRIGDQVGTLLAGAYALQTADVVTLEHARGWARSLDFSEAREAEQVSDEHNCIDRIMQSQIRFDGPDGRSMLRTVSEVVMRAAGESQMAGLTGAEANEVLARFGLRVDGSYLLVANRHPEIAKMLEKTAWGAGWKTVLRRLEGAEVGSGGQRFAGIYLRFVRIPIRSVLAGDED